MRSGWTARFGRPSGRSLPILTFTVLIGAGLQVLLQAPLRAQTFPAGASDTARAVDPLVAAEMAAPPSGLRMFRLPHGTSPLVALRLFVPVEEGPGDAGAGWILAHLAEERITAESRRLGADLSVVRSPHGISYAVSGPLSDFDYLAYLLRVATGPPDATRIAQARRELEDAIARLTETGPGQVELELRTRLPGALPTYGTPASVRSLSAARVLDVWHRSHRPERMTLLFAGDIERALLLASTVELGASVDGRQVSPDAPAPPPVDLPRIDILRRFGGRAWRAPEPLDPRMAVVARLAADLVRSEPGQFEARVQLWETTGGSVMAVTGAAFPARFGDLEAAMERLPSRLRETPSSGAVGSIAATLAGDVLAEAGTPLGRVGVVGRFMDATGSPAAARAYLDRLDAMDADAVDAMLAGLGPPAAVTVR